MSVAIKARVYKLWIIRAMNQWFRERKTMFLSMNTGEHR